MKWVRTLSEVYNNLQKQTKFLLKLCGLYILTLTVCCIACRICAGHLLGYYTAVTLAENFFAAIRPCVGVTALGSLLMEGLLLKT